ncbi:hypothetical protein [Pectobacterium aroidearum]|uniref:hypothetical protein n=1 Tax=Pectobacterium aroidearum TaxID=1201031 RepID=UPI0015DE8B5D|nr:hypothetical protein [Pectobacterium aroidearum]MBA0204411.1 hypothetical protein [Pectobacterium aroidearum]
MRYSLYYPSIEFRDPEFLKKSLLVWDKVFRIVPPSYQPNDSPGIILASQAEFVVDIHVDDNDKKITADNFIRFHERIISHDNQLVWPAGLDSESFVRINPEKIEARLLPLFEELNKHFTKDGFMNVPADIVGGYMFYLANSVAKRRDLHLLTDSPDSWVVGTYFSQDGNFSEFVSDDNCDQYMCQCSVDSLLPNNLSEISMDKIFRFCEEHREEKENFRSELEKLRMELARCNNKSHAQYIANDFVLKLNKAKQEYKDSLRILNPKNMYSIFTVGIPASASVMSLFRTPWESLNIAAGVSMGAIAALFSKNMIPHNKGTGSYLVSLDRISSEPTYQLNRAFNEFIND